MNKSHMQKYRIDNPFTERASKLRYKSKKLGLPCDVTGEGLESLWLSQAGLDSYTKEEMTLEPGYLNTFSVDRKFGERGYLMRNLVLCTCANNSKKGKQTPRQFKKILMVEGLI